MDITYKRVNSPAMCPLCNADNRKGRCEHFVEVYSSLFEITVVSDSHHIAQGHTGSEAIYSHKPEIRSRFWTYRECTTL